MLSSRPISVLATQVATSTKRQPEEIKYTIKLKLRQNKHRRGHSYRNTNNYSHVLDDMMDKRGVATLAMTLLQL